MSKFAPESFGIAPIPAQDVSSHEREGPPETGWLPQQFYVSIKRAAAAPVAGAARRFELQIGVQAAKEAYLAHADAVSFCDQVGGMTSDDGLQLFAGGRTQRELDQIICVG